MLHFFGKGGKIHCFDDEEAMEGIPEQYRQFCQGTRDRFSYPYSYDPFMVWLNPNADKQKADNTIYTDRLLMWDYDKHNLLCKKHFGNEGQQWENRDPKKIEAFLCDWTGKKVTLIANIQYVNVSSGYPLWRLDFCEES